MAKTYSLELKSEFSEAEKIPDFIEEISLEENLKNEMKDKVMLALSEAVTNAIVHGNKEDLGKKVNVRMRINLKSVVITVRDEGQGFNPEDSPDPMKEENLLATGGRGIFLMREFADEIEYSDSGRLITMKFIR
jgi:serine/threonine-protein kinase RsbW